MKPRRALLLGSYGQTNLGDDLLMWNYLELLRSRGFDTIYVNVNEREYIPKPVQEAYPDLQFVETYRASLVEYIRLLRKVDLVVYGGGTLYKELYASTGRSPYSVIIRLMAFNIAAWLIGAKLYHLNIGIGSLRTTRGRLITKWALQVAARSVFRDRQSYDFARHELALPSAKIASSTDGLFMNRIWEKSWHTKKLPAGRGKFKAVIGVNVLSDIPDWVDRDHYVAVMRSLVRRLLDDNNFLVFIPFQYAFNPRNDLTFMHESFDDILQSYQNYTLLEEVPMDLVSSYLRQCDIFIGMRFHSLLLATVNRVPFVAITYDTKCLRFMKEVGYPHFIELEEIDLDAMVIESAAVVKRRQKIKRLLSDIAEQQYKKAEEDLRKLPL